MGLLGWLFGFTPGAAGALEKISGSLPSPVLRFKSSGDVQTSPAQDGQWLNALDMASIALRCKNNVIEQLHQRLVQAEQQCDAATHAAAAGAAVTAAETQLALARCRELELRLRAAAAEQQRAVQTALHQARSGEHSAAQARLEAERQAAAAAHRELAAELDRERAAAAKARLELVTAKQQRAGIKQQVAALQAELAEARQAHAAAAATAAQLDSSFASLREENEEVRLVCSLPSCSPPCS
jgi:chromosome segregation ATPase